MDEIDVKSAGNKAAEALGQRTNNLPGVRTMPIAGIKAQYKLAVAFDGVAPGMCAAWAEGWRKGFGK
jgi:hypothetical protein